MFTGLIQALGTLNRITDDQLQISCPEQIILADLAIGDSVAVDGVCLTVTTILDDGFVAIASPETLKRTTLGRSNITYVNLETSLRSGSKLGGHFVTGHVDSIGCLDDIMETANSWELKFTSAQNSMQLWQKQIAPYIVPKGSISVNGISLTVADCDQGGNWFKVALIPHSFHQTNLQYLQPGNLVNLEADILGKYVANLLKYRGNPSTDNTEEITPEFLAENGFI